MNTHTALKVSVFGAILVLIFPVFSRRDTVSLRIQSEYGRIREKCRPENSKYGHFLRGDNLPSSIIIILP